MNQKKEDNEILDFILDYEVRSSVFAQYIWFKWGQKILGSYFSWKVKRKYKRYMYSKIIQIKYTNK